MNKSNEALAGENNTTSPLLDTSLALVTTSSRVFKTCISIFSLVFSLVTAFNILSLVLPNSINCLTCSNIGLAKGV